MIARVLINLVALIAVSAWGAAAAQEFPTRPVRLVVPFPAGGGAEIVGRTLAESLSKVWGQPVIVDNRGGATTIIGTENVAKSPADGYTLLLAPEVFAINVAEGRELPYDSLRDFAAVTKVIEFPVLLLASSKSGFRSVTDIIAAAKRNPGKISAASLGPTSLHFLGFRLLEKVAGIELLDVPYKGSGPALNDLLGGQIDLMLGGISAGLQTAEGGRAVSIATTGLKRDPAAPNLPTVSEAGYPDYVMTAWMCILVPGQTPASMITRLNADITHVLTDRALSGRLAQLGYTAAPSSPKELDSHIRKEIDRFKVLMKKTGAVNN